jgi:peptide-methionine (R)-S-oxide reductase
MKSKNYMVSKTEAEWKKELSSEEYHVLRQKGTEPPFTGIFNDHYQKGTYTCKGCGQPLYDSTSKFKSSCGWPSFDEAIPGSIEYIKDISHGILRTEIICSKCSSHQGHIFNDGTTQTGDRYCVNAASIDFTEVKD